jgi:hypothetical protein
MSQRHLGGLVPQSKATRPLRIARSLIAGAAESPRVDFWAQVLHAHPDDKVKSMGDLIEERSDWSPAVQVLQLLENRYGRQIAELQARFQRLDLGEVFAWIMERGTWECYWRGRRPGPTWHEAASALHASPALDIRRSLPYIVVRALEARTPVAPLGTLPIGQLFHYTNKQMIFRIVRHLDDETEIECVRPPNFSGPMLTWATDLVFPVGEDFA